MRIIVTGLLLCFGLILSRSVEGAQERYQIIAFAEGVKKAVIQRNEWKICGNYFAAGEVPDNGKIINFLFERRTPNERVKVINFISINHIGVSIKKKTPVPMVIIQRNNEGRVQYLVLEMNAKDYQAALPCLGKGTEI